VTEMNHEKAVRDDHFLTQLAAVAKTYGSRGQVAWQDPASMFLKLVEVGWPLDPPRPTDVVDLIPALVDRVKKQAADLRALRSLLRTAKYSLGSLMWPKGHTRESILLDRNRRIQAQSLMGVIDQALSELNHALERKLNDPKEIQKKAREIMEKIR
jgi:hypothetical protein